MEIKLGLDTFADNTETWEGEPIHPATTIRNVIDQGKLADELKLDAFGIGEHHRADYAATSPTTILAGLATVTNHIILGTAVTVLSSEDPVRVYEQFATLQALSNDRAEIMAGRGSFIESFPLFGFDLADYEILYEEKLDLLNQLLLNQTVTWSGATRSPLTNQNVYPPTETPIPLHVAVGGTPNSVIRAANHNLSIMFAIIGGDPARFEQLVTLYKDNSVQEKPIGIHSMGHIAATDEQATQEFFQHYETFHNKLGAERGWGKLTKPAYLNEIKHGSLYVGSPETVAKKIVNTLTVLEAQRFDMKYATGTMNHNLLMESINLYGTKVQEIVKNEMNV